jgi:hypothetical protein
MIVVTALFPLRVINSLPFDSKILKIGDKMWSYWVNIKMSAEKWAASCIPLLNTHLSTFHFLWEMKQIKLKAYIKY